MRIAYLIEIDPREVPQLAYVAGLLTGQGVPQGNTLAAALDRMQIVEVPDEFGGLEASNETEPGVAEDDEQADNLIQFPTPINDEGEELPTNLPPIDVATDPTAPENLGIALNQPAPPPPPGPQNHQSDFGAGPDPRDG